MLTQQVETMPNEKAVRVDLSFVNNTPTGSSRSFASSTSVQGEDLILAMVVEGTPWLTSWCVENLCSSIVELSVDGSGESLQRAGRALFRRACSESDGQRLHLTLVIVNLGRRQITTFHLGSCAAKLFVTGREWSHRALPLTKSRRDSDGSFSDLSSGSTSPVRTSCDRAQDVTRGEALNPACSTVPLPTGGADLIVCSTAIWAEVRVVLRSCCTESSIQFSTSCSSVQLEDVAIRDILKHAPAANIASKLVIDQAMAAHVLLLHHGPCVHWDPYQTSNCHPKRSHRMLHLETLASFSYASTHTALLLHLESCPMPRRVRRTECRRGLGSWGIRRRCRVQRASDLERDHLLINALQAMLHSLSRLLTIKQRQQSEARWIALAASHSSPAISFLTN